MFVYFFFRKDYNGCFGFFWINDDYVYCDIFVIFIQVNVLDIGSGMAYSLYFGFFKVDCLFGLVGDKYFLVIVGQFCFYQLIVFVDGNSVNVICLWMGVGFDQCFFDQAIVGVENNIIIIDEFFICQVLNINIGFDIIVFWNSQDILNYLAV